MSYSPIELLERDAREARTAAKVSFKFRRGPGKAARAKIAYAKFLRDLLKGTFLSGDDLRYGRQKNHHVRTPSVTVQGTLCELPGDFSWAKDVIAGLRGLADLPENWNSYRALRVKSYPVKIGWKVLGEILPDGTPAPLVGPLADGGVEFEWHFKQVDIELEVTPEGRVIVLVEDLETDGDEWEADITNDLNRLKPYIEKLPRDI